MESVRLNPARTQGPDSPDATVYQGLTTHASLSDLPPELVLHIVEELFQSHQDDNWLNGYLTPEWAEDIDIDFRFTRFQVWRVVANLAATCKGLYACITPTLYRKDIKHASSSALLRSAKNGNVSAIAKSLMYGADVNATDETAVLERSEGSYTMCRFHIPSEMTSLHWASYYHHLEAMELLLRQGADISLRETSLEKWPSYRMKCDAYLQTRLYFKRYIFDSSSMGRVWMLGALCEGANALYFSLLDRREPYYGPLEAFYQHSSFCEPPDERSNESRLSAATLLIQAGASLTTHTGIQLNALHQACASRDHEMAQLLLEGENKPDVNVRDLLGNTPLHHVAICTSYYAAKDPQPILQLLLKHGADFNATNASGLTPLQEYCRSRGKYPGESFVARRDVYPVVIRKFVEAGASLSPFPNITNDVLPLQGNQRDSEWVAAIADRLSRVAHDPSLSVSEDDFQDAEKRAIYMGMYQRLHQHHQDGQAGLEIDRGIADWTLEQWGVFWDAKFLEKTTLASLSKEGREWAEINTAVG